MDFSDQVRFGSELAHTNELVGQRMREQYTVVLLDEYQDTSRAQLAPCRPCSAGTPGDRCGRSLPGDLRLAGGQRDQHRQFPTSSGAPVAAWRRRCR
jgi:DNA helicase-2/ATP-dependent DNA helicase PcrA